MALIPNRRVSATRGPFSAFTPGRFFSNLRIPCPTNPRSATFPETRQVFSAEGKVLTVPDDWSLLPPGDAALSRRIKQDGPTWTVIEKVGNKRFSRGIWAPTARIEALRAEREIERQDPAYQKNSPPVARAAPRSRPSTWRIFSRRCGAIWRFIPATSRRSA
jgi:hypothetical protein